MPYVHQTTRYPSRKNDNISEDTVLDNNIAGSLTHSVSEPVPPITAPLQPERRAVRGEGMSNGQNDRMWRHQAYLKRV